MNEIASTTFGQVNACEYDLVRYVRNISECIGVAINQRSAPSASVALL